MVLFFDRLAPSWDKILKEVDYRVAERVLARSGCSSRDFVLDVGSGTGLLISAFAKKQISNTVSIDISPEMIRVLKNKFPDRKALCGDFLHMETPTKLFDKIFIYNAFPHFQDSSLVFKKSNSLLCPKGTLVIAHSLNRNELNAVHARAGAEVEKDVLISNEAFLNLYQKNGFDSIEVEDADYFYSCGLKID